MISYRPIEANRRNALKSRGSPALGQQVSDEFTAQRALWLETHPIKHEWPYFEALDVRISRV
jgi:hypothetical protein